MTRQPDPTRRPWWSRLRFRVRGLIVLIALIGGGLGWLVRSAHIQRDAVTAIRRAGGQVSYDWELKNGLRVPNGRQWAPRWLVDRIGVDFFGKVVHVTLRGPGEGEALADIGKLGHLEALNLSFSSVTDAGLVHLGGLTRMRSLNLSFSSVTDAGLVHLGGLTRMWSLNLNGTQVGDAGLAYLEGMTHLEYLELRGTRVVGAGLANLKRMNRLKMLDLAGSKVNDSAMEHLKGLTCLSKLELDGTAISDAGLSHLGGLTGLQELDLTRTDVSDAGLSHLKGLTALGYLDLRNGTRVTEAGVKALQQSLPKTRIVSTSLLGPDGL